MRYERIITKSGIPCVEYGPLNGHLIRIRMPVEVDVTPSRRAAIAMLGLAPASAIAADSFLVPLEPDAIVETGATSDKVIATALRNLADSFENGKTAAGSIEYNCKLEADAIVEHVLNVRFCYNPDKV